MRLHIIQPTHYVAQFKKKLYKTGKRELVPLSLPYLAALVPRDMEVILTDEQVQSWDPHLPCDGVFITATIPNSFRAYDMAKVYRSQGIPVVMGGPHCTFYQDEVLKHADAIAVGEGEKLVPRILADLAQGTLERLKITSSECTGSSIPGRLCLVVCPYQSQRLLRPHGS